jgi:hypothetical protein
MTRVAFLRYRATYLCNAWCSLAFCGYVFFKYGALGCTICVPLALVHLFYDGLSEIIHHVLAMLVILYLLDQSVGARVCFLFLFGMCIDYLYACVLAGLFWSGSTALTMFF